jgi:hypothetical protein
VAWFVSEWPSLTPSYLISGITESLNEEVAKIVTSSFHEKTTPQTNQLCFAKQPESNGHKQKKL